MKGFTKDFSNLIGHDLLKKQFAEAMNSNNELDIQALFQIISTTYEDSDKERRIMEHTMAEMSSEVMQANQELRSQRDELLLSKERYTLAEKATNDGLWEWNLSTNSVYYSERWKAILGISSKTKLDKIEDWLNLIHPDYKEQVKEAIDAHLNKRFDRIDLEYRIKHSCGEYIWVSARGLASYDSDGNPIRIAGAQTEITARKAHEQELSYAAFHDDMTGLPNRTLFMDRLQQVVNRCQRLGEKPAAVMFIDLDRFKFINDTLGHAIGDLLLKEVASLLLEAVRPGDTVSRIGGDEFTILLQEVDGKEDAIQVVERVRNTINKYYDLDGRNVEVTASVGVYLFNGTECMADQVLRNADLAMYHSKNEKRGHYELFGTSQHKKMLDDLQIELDLREALNDGQLLTYYQPIVDLNTGKLERFEALVRMRNPEQGLILPGQFIGIAESRGLIASLGEFILKDVLHQLGSGSLLLEKKTAPV